MVVRFMTQAQRNAKKSHCKFGHPFSKENTVLIKNPRHGGIMRQCRECKRERDRMRMRAKAVGA